MNEEKIWQSWNDKDGYGYWDSKGEAEQYCDDDFDPVLFVPASVMNTALLEACRTALYCLEDVFGKNKVDVGAINALRAAIAAAKKEN